MIAARAWSGAATACITPATLATLKHSFDDRERPTAIAVWTASFGLGAAVGPVLAGWLVTRGGVSAVLLANLPPIAVCAWGSLALVPVDLPRRDLALDFRGAGLCLVAAGGCLFAILRGPSHGWLGPEVLSSAAVAAGSLLLARNWLRRTPHPLLDLSLFREARFKRALLVIFLGYFAFSGVSFVVAQYLQLARAKDAFDSGLLTLPLPSSMLMATLFAPRLLLRWGAVRALQLSLGTACTGVSLLACASYGQSDLLLCAALVPLGAGSGSAFATATELALGSVTQERAATAAAISESAFEFGGLLGIALLSTLLGSASFTQTHVSARAPHALWAAALALLSALLVAMRLSCEAPQPVGATRSACSDR